MMMYLNAMANGIDTFMNTSITGFASTKPLSSAKSVKMMSVAVSTNNNDSNNISAERALNVFSQFSMLGHPISRNRKPENIDRLAPYFRVIFFFILCCGDDAFFIKFVLEDYPCYHAPDNSIAIFFHVVEDDS